MSGIRITEYLDSSGRSPFRRWFDALDATAAARVGTALYRLEQGNFSSVKGVGAGVFEYRIDFGSVYRICFLQGWTHLGDSAWRRHKGQRQSVAIGAAVDARLDYKRRKAAR